ncbi:MAG: amidophosphoribosyltransferase [Clostridiales bacterium]|nr:amidophosphoribosyltransferase [Clostridiales bacterium]
MSTRPCFEWIKPRHDRMPEECGVVGMYDAGGAPVSEALYYGLYALQHRGQESAGIALSDGRGIRYHKAMGLVTECFSEGATLKNLGNGSIGIGHVRYSTAGSSQVVNAQPLVVRYKNGTMALAHNGNLINAQHIRGILERRGVISQTALDTEVIANLIARFSGDDIVGAIRRTMEYIRGAYSLVIMTETQLIGVRDPGGVRPLALGRLGDAYMIASESCAFDAVGADFIRDLRPGEIVVVDRSGLRSIQTETPPQSHLCIFEFVYFARTDSVIDGVSVYQARENAGRLLARSAGVEADMVSGVPDSAITAAIGYSKESGIPYGEGLAKNRYVGRTFIQPQQSRRETGVRIKLNALRKNVQGKRVVLVDDSIVRGTTSRKIVEMLRCAGAREVHMLISSPPVVYPCFFGIDTPDREQLIGARNSVEQIRAKIGADTLCYLPIEDLLKTVDGAVCGFCQGCFNSEYPLDPDAFREFCPPLE